MKYSLYGYNGEFSEGQLFEGLPSSKNYPPMLCLIECIIRDTIILTVWSRDEKLCITINKNDLRYNKLRLLNEQHSKT